MFYDYGLKELFHYVPRGCSSLDSSGCSARTFSPHGELMSPSDNDLADFCMIDVDNEAVIESFLNQV